MSDKDKKPEKAKDTKRDSSGKPPAPPVSPKPKSEESKKGSDTEKPVGSPQTSADNQKLESQIYEAEASEGKALPNHTEHATDPESEETLPQSQQNENIETQTSFVSELDNAEGQQSVDQIPSTTVLESTQENKIHLEPIETDKELQEEDNVSLVGTQTAVSVQTSQPKRDSDDSDANSESELPYVPECGETVPDDRLKDIPSVKRPSFDNLRHEPSIGGVSRRYKAQSTPTTADNQFLTPEYIKKLYAQRDQEESELRNRGKFRTLEEIRGPKSTGTHQFSEEEQENEISLDDNDDPLIKHKASNTRISRVSQRWEEDFDEIIVYEKDSKQETVKTTEIIEEKEEEISAEIKSEPSISQMHYHMYGLLRDIGVNTVNPCDPIDDGTPIDPITPFKIDMNRINELFAAPQSEYGTYEMETGSRSYYEGCEYHFPGRNHWSRLFRDGFQGTYLSRLPMHWVYTVLSTVGYILFVFLFSMAWFDHITEDMTNNQPITKMLQPHLSLSPTATRGLTFDPRNDTEVNDMYTRILDFFKKYENLEESERFGPCTADQKFGYMSRSPCVFLKIHRLIGFKTVPYTHPDQVDREHCKTYDEMILKSLLRNITSQEERQNRIWLTCSTKPKNKIQIEFYPEPAIRTEYTDIEEKFVKDTLDQGDLNRIVALKLRNLRANERIDINCKIWAQNIYHNEEDFGQVSFFVIMGHEKNRQRVQQALNYHDSL
ncbi:uncharacterized protein [Drosophila pseudoobscura]|uniref:Uncharacterized protein n=1 Tax=Drosophila pseudoobscura pseudoobscura TaxID=46245 RepID=A0A6I8VZQ9_DROPS|nr:uncharacterized protein LOC26533597 [Drosophila pseudoobscura]